MFYTVGEMAKRLGVAPSTLRYYDKEGLLPFVERSRGGVRMFKEWYYKTAKEAGTTSIPRNMTLDELPKEYRDVRKALRGE